MPNAYEIDIHWTPDLRVVAADFTRYAEEVSDFTYPLAQVAEIAAADARARFASEGPGWAGWSEPYGEERSTYPGATGETILDLTGAMREHAEDPISYSISRTRGGAVGGFGELYYIPLDDVDYYHQQGTVKMPARPFIGLSSLRQATGVFEIWLDQIFAGFGSGETATEKLVVTPFGVRFRNVSTGRFVSA